MNDMNEERKEENGKRNTVLLTVIGIATLLVALVGATFAYFTASLTGNPDNDNVNITTDTYGLTVIYEKVLNPDYPDEPGSDEFITKDTISILNANLPQSEADDDDATNYPQDSIRFRVESDSNQPQLIDIKLNVTTNTFCQEIKDIDATICNDAEQTPNIIDPIDVSDELYYELYICEDNTYDDGSCTVKKSAPMPIGNDIIGAEITVPGYDDDADEKGVVYLVLKAFIKNKETQQNYNQDRAFLGRVLVAEYLTP